MARFYVSTKPTQPTHTQIHLIFQEITKVKSMRTLSTLVCIHATTKTAYIPNQTKRKQLGQLYNTQQAIPITLTNLKLFHTPSICTTTMF